MSNQAIKQLIGRLNAIAPGNLVRSSIKLRYDVRYRLRKRYADMKVGARKPETHNSTSSIVLTFDDYGTAEQIQRLLTILQVTGVRAVFFIQGDWAKTHRKELNTIMGAGHFIGNHTYSHPDLLGLTDAEIRQELREGPDSRWLRPPRGRYNARVRRIAAEEHMSIKYWSLDTDDWQGLSAETMYERIMRGIHPGAVILMHIHGAHTAGLLPLLISGIRERGMSLVGPGEEIWGET